MMTIYAVVVLGPWGERKPAFSLTDWDDITGQASEVIPTSLGLCAWRGWCEQAALEALQADSRYRVLRVAEVEAAHEVPAEWPATVERGEGTDAFPALPAEGPLEAGVIYQYGEQCVIVRQSHNRTIYEPDQTPALFSVYRADASDVLAWVANEPVYVGTRRTYEGVTYRCIMAHMTQSDWTPDATPALWSMVVETPSEPPATTPAWAPGVAYQVSDVVTYGGVEYQCRQAHTAIVTWEPPNVLALWLPL